MGIRLTKADCKALGIKMPSKYGNKITTVDGIKFHSRKEAKRYGELKAMEQGGYIVELVLQPKFPLLVNGEKIGEYRADFSYRRVIGTDDSVFVVEDVKGGRATKTPLYRWKRKHVIAQYGIHVKEI